MKSILIACLSILTAASVHGGVKGYIIRIEAPVSLRMGLHEIEVISGGRNIVLNSAKVVFAGVGGKGIDINNRNASRNLIDGRKNVSDRGLRIEAAQQVNPWVELFLGDTHDIEEIIIYRSTRSQYHDRHLRLLTVLDDERRIVAYQKFDIREEPLANGVMRFKVEPAKGKFAGHTVPLGTGEWLSLGDFLETNSPPPHVNADARKSRFEQRDSTPSVKELASRFFARMDLSSTALKEVNADLMKGNYQGALDEYRTHFFGKIRGLENLWGHTLPNAMYATQARDLMNGISVSFEQSHNSASVQATRFTPGQFHWAHIPEDKALQPAALTMARANAYVNHVQRPLLWAYAKTGNTDYLKRWAEITDDWAMNFVEDAENSPHDIRNYFVKEGLQKFFYFCYELDQIAQKVPDIETQIPSTTLARLLMLVVEEYPPAYWRVCRKTVFNHTYNALIAAFLCGDILDDFHAGQRLTLEARQHMERIWTYGITRDGSMMEIGDEGHLTMHLRIGRIYLWLLKKNPPWLTDAFKTRFEDGWRTTCTYVIRHITPNGMGHRFSHKDMFPAIWSLTQKENTIGGQKHASPTWHDPTIFSQSEVRAIIDTVYGRGRIREDLKEDRQEAYDKVVAHYGGDYQGPPKMKSDWMPYAGLHYLRGGWNDGDIFIHMLGQKTGSESSNPSEWNTEFRMWSHGRRMLESKPLIIDGLGQHPDFRKQTGSPGSKTARLTQAPCKPIPARWYSSENIDFAETVYDGPYAREGSARAAVNVARTIRQLILHRASRLLVVVDRVEFADPTKQHVIAEQHAMSCQSDARNITSAQPESHKPERTTLTYLSNARYAEQDANLSALVPPPVNVALDEAARWPGRVFDSKGNFLVIRVVDLDSSNEGPNPENDKSLQSTTTELDISFSKKKPSGAYLTCTISNALKRDTALPEILLKWHKPDGSISGFWVGETGKEGEYGYEFASPGLKTLGVVRRPIDPVTISPDVNVFTDSMDVALTSESKNVEIRYTLDGSDPTPSSKRYEGPFTITNDTFVKARAMLKGLKEIPFTAAGTEASAISYGYFTKRPLLPAIKVDRPKKGLRYEYVEDNWFRLFSYTHLPEIVTAKSSGISESLLDVSMRQTDGPFGVRYSGYLYVPKSGIYTFYGPEEYVNNICEPGYDLRVYVDDEEWYLGQSWHGLGRWSVPLAKGAHRFAVTFADARARDVPTQKTDLWRGYPSPSVVWTGEVPKLEMSGPDMERQIVPDSLLWHE